MKRRVVLGLMAQAAVGMVTARASAGAEEKPLGLPEPSPKKLPRWRGFNLLEMFQERQAQPFREDDFARIAELGFDFVRLPMDYRCWTDPQDWTKLREERLHWIDEAVQFGRKHGVHVQMNFHRAPGYTVANPPEPKSLWTDPEAQDACALHWSRFARRYQGVPSREISFNLFNEPARVGPEPHRMVVERMVRAIREHDRDRLIVYDGRDWGTKPPEELVGLDVAAATRGYAPFHVVLVWMQDSLDAWKMAGWGWALWNFRGGFGILDSDRTDVSYEDWHGHKLDRAMLKLLQSE